MEFSFKLYLEATELAWPLGIVGEWVINPDTGLPMAAGVLPICKTTGKILPNRRAERNVRGPRIADGHGQLSTWGGALDDGETPEAAAKRELREEAGFSGNAQIIPAFVWRNDKYEYHNFIALVDEEFQPKINWESQSSGWMTWEELSKSSSQWHPAFADLMAHSGQAISKLAKAKPDTLS